MPVFASFFKKRCPLQKARTAMPSSRKNAGVGLADVEVGNKKASKHA